MGIENYLLTSSLVAVLAQRLVRVICKNCKQPAAPAIGPGGERVPSFRGIGCETCFNTGYRGRVGIFELMELNEELRAIIMRNEDASKITAAARRHGMRNLREDGWLKIRNGVTTPDEVMRVTQEF
jgi:type II secretory ATPase GspE/PulE/Tfp pilus assembly ATPase PilB-like protein